MEESCLDQKSSRIHTDTALIMNKKSGMDSTVGKIHAGVAPKTNGEPDYAGQTFTSCLSEANSCEARR